MSDFKKYLATEILSEQQTLSYRNLARTQKVHVNVAKCMLYEFYEDQIKRKPGSLYATYLIAGAKKQEKSEQNGANGHDEDEPMPSSPPPFTSSMLDSSQHENEIEKSPTRTITLVREEFLKDVKSEYETITSIHIYSLSPSKIPDLVTLTDIGRGLYADVFSKEDPFLHNRTYGVIQNAEVRRRTGKRPVVSSAPASKFQPVNPQPKAAPAPSKPSTLKKEETTSRPSSRDSTSTRDSKKPSLNRGSSGAADLFKAFTKSQPPKPKKNDSQNAKMSDAPKLASDDEGESEEEALFLDTGARKPAKRASEVKKERDDKAAKLRKMMDSDDEEPAVPKVEDAAAKASGPLVTDKAPEGEDGEGVTWSDSDNDGKTEEASQPEGPKRKRGKRKVMKKKTTKDKEGYLVTKEEAVWESFSESDNEPAKKPVPKSSGFAKTQGSQSQGSQKSAAGGKAAKGKGDIMSFFGKR